MIEQIMSLQAPQNLDKVGSNSSPLSANPSDVMKFNMSMSEPKVENHSLLDVSAKDNNGFLELSDKKIESNPILQMDKAYRSIMVQMKDSPQFTNFQDIRESEHSPKFRSNIESIEETPDAKAKVKDMLAETRDLYTEAKSMAKDISKWQIKTTIWSTNVKFFTSVVSQASTGIKTLFQSAG